LPIFATKSFFVRLVHGLLPFWGTSRVFRRTSRKSHALLACYQDSTCDRLFSDPLLWQVRRFSSSPVRDEPSWIATQHPATYSIPRDRASTPLSRPSADDRVPTATRRTTSCVFDFGGTHPHRHGGSPSDPAAMLALGTPLDNIAHFLQYQFRKLFRPRCYGVRRIAWQEDWAGNV